MSVHVRPSASLQVPAMLAGRISFISILEPRKFLRHTRLERPYAITLYPSHHSLIISPDRVSMRQHRQNSKVSCLNPEKTPIRTRHSDNRCHTSGDPTGPALRCTRARSAHTPEASVRPHFIHRHVTVAYLYRGACQLLAPVGSPLEGPSLTQTHDKWGLSSRAARWRCGTG